MKLRSLLPEGSVWVEPGDFEVAPAVGGDAGAVTAAAVPAIVVGRTGDFALRGFVARDRYRVSGAGVKVGIMSDSFNVKGAMAADIAAGALPANVTILKEGASGADEGRAMAELVHRVAPGADIYFYTAFSGQADFANGILALASAGCDVIVDDVGYFAEPFFQVGSAIDKAIDTVVSMGVSYFTAAGNEGEDFYESRFNGYSLHLPGLKGNYVAQNFSPAGAPSPYQSVTVPVGDKLLFNLQWDEPFASIGAGHAAANSLGMVLYDASNHIVARVMHNDVGTDPTQTLSFTNTTASTSFRLAIVANGGTTTPGLFKYISLSSGGVVVNDPNFGVGSGSSYGHTLLASANSVGAIAAADAPTRGGSGQVEYFTSAGPGTILFDASGARLGSPLSAGKVDFVAPDGVMTDVFKPFYGTSAAAPDAAGVAALMLEAKPGLSPAQVTSILKASAITVTGPANTTGAGLIQAPAAVKLALATVPAADTASFGPLAFAVAPGWVIGGDLLRAAVAEVDADPTASGFWVDLEPEAAAWLAASPGGATAAAAAEDMSLLFAPV